MVRAPGTSRNSRVLRVLLAVVGVAMLALGGSAATYVGADGVVRLDPVEIDDSAGVPVVTDPVGFAWTDVEVNVTARAEAGGVFIATGNPVDVADLVSGTDHVEITAVDRAGLSGADVSSRRVLADRGRPELADPATLDVWSLQKSGAGVQELTLHLRGEPRTLLALADDDGAVTMTFGARLPRVFGLGIGVATVGVALLVVAVALSRIAARPRRAAGPPPACAVALLAIVSMTAAGCGFSPTSVEVATFTKPALVPVELGAFWQAYDERNNAAVRKASLAPYDRDAWKEVDTGIVLRHDLYATAYDRFNANRDEPATLTHEPAEVYARSFASYPMWAVVVSRGESEELPGGEAPIVNVVLKDAVAEPWIATAEATLVRGGDDELPVPAPTEEAAAADAATREADGLVAGLVEFWVSGHQPDALEIPEEAQQARRDAVDRGGGRRTTFAAERFRARGGDSWEIAVDGGTLAVRSIVIEVTIHADAGESVEWTDPADQQLLTAAEGYLRFRTSQTVLLHLPDEGKAEVLATSVRPIL